MLTLCVAHFSLHHCCISTDFAGPYYRIIDLWNIHIAFLHKKSVALNISKLCHPLISYTQHKKYHQMCCFHCDHSTEETLEENLELKFSRHMKDRVFNLHGGYRLTFVLFCAYCSWIVCRSSVYSQVSLPCDCMSAPAKQVQLHVCGKNPFWSVYSLLQFEHTSLLDTIQFVQICELRSCAGSLVHSSSWLILLHYWMTTYIL